MPVIPPISHHARAGRRALMTPSTAQTPRIRRAMEASTRQIIARASDFRCDDDVRPHRVVRRLLGRLAATPSQDTDLESLSLGRLNTVLHIHRAERADALVDGLRALLAERLRRPHAHPLDHQPRPALVCRLRLEE